MMIGMPTESDLQPNSLAICIIFTLQTGIFIHPIWRNSPQNKKVDYQVISVHC